MKLINYKKKILILGSAGMLGHQLYNFFNNKNYLVQGICRRNKSVPNKFFKNKQFLNLDLEKFDLLENTIHKYRPDFIINCAGVIKQKSYLYDKNKIFLINACLPNYLRILSKKLKYKLIHISTDCVYDGKKGNYKEDDFLNSTDDYGLSKALGEVFSDNCITLRTSIIGHELNQCNGLLEWFLKQKKVYGFKKAFFSGLTTLELSKVIEKLLKKKINNGIYNVASKKISKYELLVLINKIYDKNITILPSNKLKIDRSLNGKLFEKKTNIKISSWKKMIVEMCKY
ncbi:SDR family oxidoreductase [Candidatus Pelagibacter sp.]|jgi:dTDP-4-dehydrorhamnose reductase|nr:SDR family oxidoreductase [Candidatus Pelagibacter sp.]